MLGDSSGRFEKKPTFGFSKALRAGFVEALSLCQTFLRDADLGAPCPFQSLSCQVRFVRAAVFRVSTLFRGVAARSPHDRMPGG